MARRHIGDTPSVRRRRPRHGDDTKLPSCKDDGCGADPARRTKKKSGKNHNGKGRRDVVRYAVEEFFSWLKNGFHRLRIRYGRKSENRPAFANIASLVMYFRVLG